MDVGVHCGYMGCKQRDFLPFTCSDCAITFCLDHRSVTAHICTKAGARNLILPTCPKCKVRG